jgi:calcineurin-like phosphoesterase family protein
VIFVTSDHHLFHKNIIKYTKRPFSSVEEMNEVMIRKWNEVVGSDDWVIHCGDFGLAPMSVLKEIFDQLNGRKSLIKGNHDNRSIQTLLKIGWCGVFTQIMIRFEGKNLLFVHQPLHGDIPTNVDLVFHGHVHNNEVALPKYNVNICVEMTDYAPITLEQAIKKAKKEKKNYAN